MSIQKTRHQKLNSYWVMNSIGDNLSTQQRYILPSHENIKICMYANYVCKPMVAFAPNTSYHVYIMHVDMPTP